MRAAAWRVVLAALLLLPATAQAAMTSRDLNAAFDELDTLGGFFGAIAARETNGFAQERWRRLSLGYPGTAEILRGLLARERLLLADLPAGRVSAVLDRGIIAIDRDLDGLWSGGLMGNGEGAEAVRRRDILLPALFEGLARRQPPQDWPWLADHLRAVGGFAALAQDPVARPLLARLFYAKDSYLRLALQRISEGDPAVRRALAGRQAATVSAVRGLAVEMAATFGPAPADRLRQDWAGYVASVDGFSVTRGWLLLDPALRQTQLGAAARREAGAVKQAAAEMVAEAPRSAVAAARAEAASAALPAPARPAAAAQGPGVNLGSLVDRMAAPDPEAAAPEPALSALAAQPEAVGGGLNAAAFRAFAARIKEAAEPDPQGAIAEREQQLGAARAEVATLQSKLDSLLAAMEARAAEAERLEAALAAERERRASAERRAAAQAAEAAEAAWAAAEAARQQRAAAPAAPQPAVLPPPAIADNAAEALSLSEQRQLYVVAAVAVIVLLALLLWQRRRRRPPLAQEAPLMLAAPAAAALSGALLEVADTAPRTAVAPAAAPPAAGRPRAAPQRGRPVRVNGVAPPTAESRAAMKAASARHEAARSGVAAPAADPGTEADTADPGSEADTAANPIVTALRRGNLPLFELLFGELTDLRAPQLQRIVYGGRGEDLAIVCRAVGVDKLLFGAIFMLTDHLRGGAAEEEPERTAEMLRMYDRMPPATARKVLAKWQSNWSGGALREPVSDV